MAQKTDGQISSFIFDATTGRLVGAKMQDGSEKLFAFTDGTQTFVDLVATTLTVPTAAITTLTTTNVDAGASGTAGSLDIFPATAAKGKLTISATDSTGNTTTSITNAAMGQATALTIPDPGSATASFVLATGATGPRIDGVNLSGLKWVDVTVTAALLDNAGTVAVITGVAGDQYKIRDMHLVGGGTNFAAGGDRAISLTDGTTVWTTIANADIESAPSASLNWGNTKVPFLTGTVATASVAGETIRFQYSGGTTDHSATGSISFCVCLEKVA